MESGGETVQQSVVFRSDTQHHSTRKNATLVEDDAFYQQCMQIFQINSFMGALTWHLGAKCQDFMFILLFMDSPKNWTATG